MRPRLLEHPRQSASAHTPHTAHLKQAWFRTSAASALHLGFAGFGVGRLCITPCAEARVHEVLHVFVHGPSCMSTPVGKVFLLRRHTCRAIYRESSKKPRVQMILPRGGMGARALARKSQSDSDTWICHRACFALTSCNSLGSVLLDNYWTSIGQLLDNLMDNLLDNSIRVELVVFSMIYVKN